MGSSHLQQVSCASGSHQQRLDRGFEIVPRTGWRGKVENSVERAFDLERLGNVYRLELDPWVAIEPFQVPLRSAEEIVKTDDGVTLREESLREMGSDEPSRAAQ